MLSATFDNPLLPTCNEQLEGSLSRVAFSFLVATGKALLMDVQGMTYQVGANVRVTRGSLAGVAGVLIEVRNRRLTCLLSTDFWANGVLVKLNGDDLEQVKGNRPRL
jgi:hypothetical protein